MSVAKFKEFRMAELFANPAMRLDGFLGWFEAVLSPGVSISNSPRLAPTHWDQLYFPILTSHDLPRDKRSD